jgi:hypothetical protein
MERIERPSAGGQGEPEPQRVNAGTGALMSPSGKRRSTGRAMIPLPIRIIFG